MSLIVAPLISEKSSKALNKLNKYTFYVALDANKIEIAREINKQYGVKVVSVRIINLSGKKVRRGRVQGKTQDRKKAIVTLTEGQELKEIKALF